MTGSWLSDLGAALEMLPRGHFLMTSAFEGKRAGHVVRSVQMCSETPALVCVAARKGHAIAPLIRDSHAFVVCVLAPEEASVLRRFEHEWAPDEMGDAFDALPIETLRSGAPALRRCAAAIDCEVVRHFDLEADHELYIGMPIACRVARPGDRPGRVG